MEGLFGCFFTFFFIFIIGLIIWSINSSRNKSLTAVWDKFASDSGLNITFEGLVSFPRVTGTYRDFDYVLETVTEGSGEESVTYTVITVKLPEPSVCNLHIYQENFFSTIGKIFGSQDIQTGNVEFDDAFMIKSYTPDKINEVLTPDLQRKILYGSHLINMTLSEKRLQNKTGHIIDNTQDLLYLSELMVEIACNASRKEITPSTGKEISDKSYKKKSLKTEDSHKTCLSDFTSDFIDSSYESSGEKQCPSCGAMSPDKNKYCIDCGREI